jgi:UDP-glucose:(heptosyl)LPS alpha-1,3-glucosyltransferase
MGGLAPGRKCRDMVRRIAPQEQFTIAHPGETQKPGETQRPGETHRIALLVGRFIPSLGGLESWTHDLAVELVARGHQVRVLTTETAVHPAGVRIDLVPASDRTMPQARNFATAAARFADHIVHDTGVGLGADVLQPQMGCRALNIARDTAQLPRWRRLRLAASPRHQRYRRAIARLERSQLATARCVIAVSRETAAVFRDRYGLPEDRIRIIPNGIDTQRFHPARTAHTRGATRDALGLTPETLVLLAAASNFRLKGVHHSIAALAKILPHCPNACLLVAGEGPVDEFAALAHAAGVGDRVRFLGRVTDMPALFGATEIFVHPTAHDACSLATLEAMASGLPVITTRRNGAADGMTQGREGFVLGAPDVAALADKLLALRDPARRTAMGAAARLLAERHDFAATVDQLISVYADLLPLPGNLAA